MQSIFIIKLQFQPCKFDEKESLSQVCSSEVCKLFFASAFSINTFRWLFLPLWAGSPMNFHEILHFPEDTVSEINNRKYINMMDESKLIQILPNISRSKSNRLMKFRQLIEYNIRNVFLEKSCTRCRRETIIGPFYIKNQNWALDQ